MKISRSKKLQRTIKFYINNFGFREPFQILIDATFCLAALKNKVNIKEQLTKYFQSELKLLTTPCIIIEAEKLGGKVSKAAFLVKKYPIHRCGHEENPITGSACFKAMAKLTRYVIATQDRELQEWLRKRSGQPLLYLHKVAPILEPPSDASKMTANKKCEKQIEIKETDEINLHKLKETQGLIHEEIKKKFKKKKQPNPLSCKKKKKKPNNQNTNEKNQTVGGVEKKKKIKLKISKHLKEHFKTIKDEIKSKV